MVAVPEQPVTEADLAAWFKAKAELARLKSTEMLLRQRVFRHYFPDPKEGTNTFVLPDNYRLKGVHTLNRKVLIEVMQAMCFRPQTPDGTYMPSKLEEARVDIAQLIKWTPELVISAYRELTAEQMHLVDQMLEISPGSPQMSVDPPAKPRGTSSKKKGGDDAEDEVQA